MQVLEKCAEVWLKQIDHGKQVRYRKFGKTAARCWDYVGKGYNDLYLQRRADAEEEFPHVKGTYYKTRLNKSRQYADVMSAYIWATVPHRLVAPSRPVPPAELAALLPMLFPGVPPGPTPEEQLRAWLMQWWQNYTAREFAVMKEGAPALQEALVKGMGVVFCELTDGPVGRVPATFFDSVDNLIWDPDSQRRRDCGYMVRVRYRPLWKIAEEFRVPIEKLRGAHNSHWKEASGEPNRIVANQGVIGDDSPDIGMYYEIYSRAGLGQHFDGADPQLKVLADALNELGPNVYLAIMPGYKGLLNLPDDLLEAGSTQSEIVARLEWPIPFWADTDPWPCSVLEFITNPDNPYATSPLEGALPIQVFLDHLYSHLMTRVRATCRDLIVTSSALEEAIRNAIVSGLDQEVVPYSGKPGEDLKSLIEVIQFPPLNKDLWNVVPIMERTFEELTGITPLLSSGSSPQAFRSAKEADVKETHATSRVDHYADLTEAWMSEAARKEGIAARLYVESEVAGKVFGESVQETEFGPLLGPLTQAWAQLVHTDDPAQAASELDYTVEAGTIRRRNKQKQLSEAVQLVQTLLPIHAQWAMAGMIDPYNNLMAILQEAMDMPLEKLMISPQALPPPPEAPPEEGGEEASPEDQPNAVL